MKKVEILKLIEVNKKINENKNLLSIIEDASFQRILIDKEYWFPNIEELKHEFKILENEVQKALDETSTNKKYIENCSCSHEVRLNHYGLFWNTSHCVLCDESIPSDNLVNWEYSKNRNKYCVILDDKHQYDDDGYYMIKEGYTNTQVIEMILDIIMDKNDEDEIDLIQEFKKLNLKKCKINEEKKINENYILIIGGSNKQYIDKESYLYKKGLEVGLDFIEYFSNLLNTKVELIDNPETMNNQKFKKIFDEKNNNLNFEKYETINQLEKILLEQKKIPFKIIIDLSELYKYKINNQEISKEIYNLKLSEYFKDSHIITIGNLSRKSLEELSKFLKENNKDYGYQSSQYYYLEDNDLKSQDLESTCNKIKKLLKK